MKLQLENLIDISRLPETEDLFIDLIHAFGLQLPPDLPPEVAQLIKAAILLGIENGEKTLHDIFREMLFNDPDRLIAILEGNKKTLI